MPTGAPKKSSPSGPAADHATVEEFRRGQRERILLPYERLVDVDREVDEASREEAQNRRWTKPGFDPVALEPPIAWEKVCSSHRSWEFHLHCWDFLPPLLAGYESDDAGSRARLALAVELARDWIDTHPRREVKSRFAWYDMAIGVRAYRLGFVLDAALRDEAFGDELLQPLVQSVLLHAEVFRDDTLFAAHSNHGFYFAAGQLALSRRFASLPAMRPGGEQALTRLNRLLEIQFSSEGVHGEHSPDYHRMMLEAVRGLLESDLVAGWTEFERIQRNLETALGWFITPDGRLVAFGDTVMRDMRASEFATSDNPELRYAASAGEAGEPPEQLLMTFPRSGYAVVRDTPARWPDAERQSYLAQTCAFHSRTHKHADDLALVWYDRGQHILLDAGMYGYVGSTPADSVLRRSGFWYSHPNRIYVESTRAHNTVEIDDRSHQRVDVAPYGSALKRARSADGLHLIESEVKHGSIRHARLLILQPGAWLVVFDWLWDNRKDPHSYSQRFHFSPELRLERRGQQIVLRAAELDMPLTVSPLNGDRLVTPARGQVEPSKLGWLSLAANEMSAAWSAAYRTDGVPAHAFVTMLAFERWTPTDGAASCSVPSSGRSLRIGWESKSGSHTLHCERPSSGPVELAYEVQ